MTSWLTIIEWICQDAFYLFINVHITRDTLYAKPETFIVLIFFFFTIKLLVL